MEKLRLALIRWNVAPLSIVALMVYGFFRAWFFYEANAGKLAEWEVAGLFTFMGAVAGILYKMYDGMQRNHDDPHDLDR